MSPMHVDSPENGPSRRGLTQGWKWDRPVRKIRHGLSAVWGAWLRRGQKR